MREFVVVGHDAPTDPDFPLDDLAGGAGRLDVLCRCVVSALLVSHGVREDSRIHLVLDDAFTVTVDGATVRRLNPDERSTAALVRTALESADEAVGAVAVEASPGVSIRRRGLAGTLDAADGVVALAASAPPVTDADPPDDPTFVLSDHHDLTDRERDAVTDRAACRVRLGPTPLHADRAITVAHHYLDTDGYRAL